eukprot:gb/GECH01000834.1/.p1 GENE.gb/GECH01000834.1/~~gb/GECH01000834.1/.p1  ORF type:complete len:351 (+),score=29.38 gb/GECH01000834.1/:1-1053(+)
MTNQIRSLASTFLLAMIMGVPHVYEWWLPCPLSTIVHETAEMGNLEYKEWKPFRYAWLDRAVKNSLVLKPKKVVDSWKSLLSNSSELVVFEDKRSYFAPIVCEANAHCRNVLFPDKRGIYSTITQHLFLPSKQVVDAYWSNSRLRSMGSLPQHLRKWMIQFDEKILERKLSKTMILLKNKEASMPPVVGAHLRFGDRAMREARLGAPAHTNEEFPIVLKCLGRMIQEQMILKNVTHGAHLLVATDYINAVPKIEAYFNKQFQDSVMVHTTSGVPRHSSHGYPSCSSEAEASFVKVFHDVIMLCHAETLFGSRHSSLTKFIVQYCSNTQKSLKNFNLGHLPPACKNFKHEK